MILFRIEALSRTAPSSKHRKTLKEVPEGLRDSKCIDSTSFDLSRPPSPAIYRCRPCRDAEVTGPTSRSPRFVSAEPLEEVRRPCAQKISSSAASCAKATKNAPDSPRAGRGRREDVRGEDPGSIILGCCTPRRERSRPLPFSAKCRTALENQPERQPQVPRSISQDR